MTRFLTKIPDEMSDTISQKKRPHCQQMSDQVPDADLVPDQLPDQIMDQNSDQISDKFSGQISGPNVVQTISANIMGKC